MDKIYIVIEINHIEDENGIYWPENLGVGEPVCWAASFEEASRYCDELNLASFTQDCDTVYRYGSLSDLFDSDDLTEQEFIIRYQHAILSLEPISFNPESDYDVLKEIYSHLYIPYFGIRSVFHVRDMEDMMTECETEESHMDVNLSAV